jgi:uncharacterized protein
MIPDKWEVLSKEHQKAYKYMLEKGNKNKMLRALPDLHEEAFSNINCLDCARCCKSHSPRFKQPDIKRIAKTLRIKEGELVDRYLKIDKEGDYVTKESPCPFLAEDNTCDIYDDRPSDCRRYPYTDEDVLIKRIQLTLKNSMVCPATYVVLEKLLELDKK